MTWRSASRRWKGWCKVPDEAPIKVTVTDPKTGEVLGETVLVNDYCCIVHGTCHIHHTQVNVGGTHVLTIKGRKS